MKIKSLIALLIILQVNIICAQSFQHPWHVIDRGGGRSSAGGTMLQGSIGQPAIQAMNASGSTLESGYIPGLRVFSGVVRTTTQSIADGWNLISVPVIVSDFRKTTLYPTATGSAFIYQGAYQRRDTLTNGVGFWLKFGSPGSVVITGSAIQRESVAVAAGWNMIGAPSYPTLVSNIVSSGTTVLSNYFGYSSSYFVEDTLEPGLGYWVKVSSSGKLVLNTGSVLMEPSTSHFAKASAENEKKRIPSQFNSLGDVNILTVNDAQKRTATLYFLAAPKEINPALFELPPPAPPGSVDVRFTSNRLVEVADHHLSKTIPITVQGMEYPLNLKWEMASASSPASIVIEKKSVAMKNQGNITITNQESHIGLILQPFGGIELPKEYALNQNFPNPFNPTTVIRYQLPAESHVTLKIYNLLGQEVKTLFDEMQDAGYKSVEWIGSESASGVYFYRIVVSTVGNRQAFSEVKKMLLIK